MLRINKERIRLRSLHREGSAQRGRSLRGKPVTVFGSSILSPTGAAFHRCFKVVTYVATEGRNWTPRWNSPFVAALTACAEHPPQPGVSLNLSGLDLLHHLFRHPSVTTEAVPLTVLGNNSRGCRGMCRGVGTRRAIGTRWSISTRRCINSSGCIDMPPWTVTIPVPAPAIIRGHASSIVAIWSITVGSRGVRTIPIIGVIIVPVVVISTPRICGGDG